MEKIKKNFIYILAAAISLILLLVAMRIWRSDISAPLGYFEDALSMQEMVKGTMENGWFLDNPRLGAPFGSELYGYPTCDVLNFFIFKVIGKVTGSWIWAFNLYFLGAFPVVTMTALHVFLKNKINTTLALVSALIYTYLPYHFLHGTPHIFLSAYYMVPLLCGLALNMFEKNGYLFKSETLSWRNLNKKRLFWVLLIALITASSGAYFAFFGMLLIFFAGALTSVNNKNILNFTEAAIITGAILSFSVLNVLPNIVYLAAHPASARVVRAFGEAEIYGLKISQLLLPRTGHNFKIFANIKEAYNTSAPLVNENDYAALGVLASLGFLFSLLALVWNRIQQASIYKQIGILNLFSVLLACVGGFGVFIAIFITDKIRAYNRISIFIGFFSILTIALLLEQYYRKHIKTEFQRKIFHFGLFGLLLLALYDQVPAHMESNAVWKEKIKLDMQFFPAVEAQLGKAAMVFQLPYMPFPESAPIVKMKDYEQVRGYLNTKSLRWSYGVFRGTPGDAFIKYLSGQTGKIFIEDVLSAGYVGVCIDRFGYADSAAAIEKQLENGLNEKPFLSPDGRYSFYDLRNYKNAWQHAAPLALEARLAEIKENLEGYYIPGNWITFADDRYLTTGWSANEGAHRWSEGRRSEIGFKLKAVPVHAAMRLVLVPKMTLGPQRILVKINNLKIGDLRIDTPQECNLEFNSDSLLADKQNSLVFEFPDAALPGGDDSRYLAVALGKVGLFFKNAKEK